MSDYQEIKPGPRDLKISSLDSIKAKRAWGHLIKERVYALPRKILWIVFCVVALSLFFSFLATNDSVKLGDSLKNRKADLERENLRLEDENSQLAARIIRYGQDPVFLEDEARRKLRLVRPGEIIYRLAEEPDLSDNEATGQLN
ncbi:MAG: septum formation initiator family protein [Deltaproteobacteria bacterium]|jgi:cell division protein FtsB|nr:septum formation initiator family protein [Deltaproteobacteria bacterium]